MHMPAHDVDDTISNYCDVVDETNSVQLHHEGVHCLTVAATV
jgi:hypothetical protein